MANQAEIQATYDWMDRIHRLRLGDHADITCAFFDGDFSKTLDQAQRDKHAWVLQGIGFKPGMRILDVGCGWGPMLRYITAQGGTAVGLTLSPAQAEACRKDGLDARILDWKQVRDGELGAFDAVVSIGALEHFCSPEEYLAGEQDRIYEDFFRFCASMLPPHGRLYLHMMVWGPRLPDPRACTLDAPKGSDERILARLMKFYPGSWLPSGKEQLIRDAAGFFSFLSSNNGRKDYIETLNRWGASSKNLLKMKNLPSTLGAIAALLPRLSERDFRVQLASVWNNDQQECFIREIMSHERMFFEKP
jgi:cyclopropane-fatty-acyl-phospholipid synthase